MKRLIAIILSATLILGLTACSKPLDTSKGDTTPSNQNSQIITPSATPNENSDVRSPSPSPTIVEEPVDPYEKGTTSWNISNDGIAASKDDWIYYYWFGNESYDSKGGLYKIKTDGTGKEQICSGVLFDINVVGDYIYYVDGNITVMGTSATRQGTSIKKVKADGESSDTIIELGYGEGAISDAFVVGEWIYYNRLKLGSDVSGFYRIKTDGSGEQKLIPYMVECVDIVEDWIYYSSKFDPNNDDDGICKIKIDGSEQQLIIPRSGYGQNTNIGVVDDWIYYVVDSYKIYKVKTDGSDPQEIVKNIDFIALNISEGWIYQTFTASDELSLKRIKIDGTDEQLLYSNMLMDNICVLGDNIFFENFNYNDAIHTVGIIKTDVSNFQIIE